MVRRELVAARVQRLIDQFDDYVETYDRSVPFGRQGQFELHARTIARRRELGSLSAALADDGFIELVWETLQVWGIGFRGSRLAPLPEFGAALRAHESALLEIEGLVLEDDGLDVGGATAALWRLVADLPITDNKAKIVAGSKTLHHLLPDLIPPIDRQYTGRFFGWPGPYFQERQEASFREALSRFAEIAKATRPSRLVGNGWRTSASKIVDNAIVAFCKVEEGSVQLPDAEGEPASRGVGDGSELERLSLLLRDVNRINVEVARLINRPALAGHIGEFVAAKIFDIALEPTAIQAGFDGRFNRGSFAGRTVNIKFYGALEYILDIGQHRPDYYLVMTGPATGVATSRGGRRPLAIDQVFLFDADRLVSALEERGIRIGVATSVRKEFWKAARIFPSWDGAILPLDAEQETWLHLFGSARIT